MIFHEQKAGASPTLKDTTWPTTGPQPATSHSGHQDSPDCQANCQAAAKDKGINSFPGCSPSVRDHDTITGIIMVTMAVLLRKALQGGIDVLLKNAHEFYEIHRNTIPGPNTSDEIQKSWPGSNSPAKKKHFPIVSPFQPLLPLSSLRYHPPDLHWAMDRQKGHRDQHAEEGLGCTFQMWKRGQRLCHNMQQHTGRSESHPSLSLLGFPHCQRCFQEVIPKSSLWWFPPCER